MFLSNMLFPAADKLEGFLKQFPAFSNAFLVGGPADVFVIELADQVIFTFWLQGVHCGFLFYSLFFFFSILKKICTCLHIL